MASELASMYVSISPNMSGFRTSVLKELRGVDSDAGAVGTSSGNAFTGAFSRAISGAGQALASVLKVGAGAALAGITAAGAVGVKTAAQLETAQIGFTTMLGSGEKAQAFLKDLTNFAAKTPFELPGLQQSASQLVATGIATEKVIPIMTTLGNITSGMGTGSEGIQRAVVAIQQMNAAQKISAEDLNQLRDAGVPVYELLSKATGKSTQQIAAMAQAGKLGKKELDALMATLESGVGLERFNGLMEKQSQSLSGLWSTAVDTFSIGMATAIEPVIPLLKEGLGGATQWLGDVAIPAVVEGAGHFASFIRTDLGPALTNVGDFIRTEVMPPVGQFGSFLRTDLIPGLQNFGGWLSQNKDWLAAIAVTLGTVVAAIQVWSAVTRTITALQVVFNAVLAANPIGIVVVAIAGLVAGLTWFFTQTQLGKEIWANVWGFITTVTDGFVTWFRDTAMPWITGALNAAGAVFTWLYENIIKPVWDGISAVVTWAYQTIIKPYFDLIAAAIQVVGGVFSWLWQNIVKPVWEGISAAIGAAWSWISENVFKPIGTAIDVLATGFTDFWHSHVEPTWKGIQDAIGTAWTWIKTNVFDPIGKFITETIPDKFKEGVKLITSAWNEVAKLAKAPIGFVVETILNNGILAAANTVARFFNPSHTDWKIPWPPSGWDSYAVGGYTGAGGKYDPAGIVHAGEIVWSQDDIARWGGVGIVEALRNAKGYAGGGLVSPLSSFVITQGFSGINGHNGIDMAAATGTPIHAAGPGRVSMAGWSSFGGGNETHIDHPNGLQTWYAHQSGFAAGLGATVSQGQTIGYVGSTGLSTGPHLHYMVLDGGWPNVLDPTPYLTGGGAPGSGGGGIFNPLENMLAGFLDQIKSNFPSAGIIGDIVTGAVKNLFDGGMAFISGLFGASTDKKGPQGGTGLPYTLYDGGGWLTATPGAQLVQHRKREPDAVLTSRQWQTMADTSESVRGLTPETIAQAVSESVLAGFQNGMELELHSVDVLANSVAARLLLAKQRR